MKSTAIRYVGKINSDFLKNSRRLFSYKFEMTPAARPEPQEETPKPDHPFRYNVCQPRTSSVERPQSIADVQRQSARAAIEEQHLQPAMLPEYFQKQMEHNALVHPEREQTEEDRINKGLRRERRFQESKTYANAILPLKSVKLANPFPEPVKMMMSRTVSDDEKAEQMLADARSQRHHADPQTRGNFRAFSNEVRRWYSNSKTVGTNAEKCKKMEKSKGGCPKMKLANCPPPARTRCDRIAKHIDCKKQEAPYPAYSEFCHEDLDEKPSECKLCPWKADENPNFKPQKKKLHTNVPLEVRRSGLEIDLTEEAVLEEEEADEGMRCDLRKPACERPKNRRCPPTKEEKKKEEVKKKEKPKKDCLGETFGDKILASVRAREFFLSKKEKAPSDHGPCKIKKFKFPKCNQVVKREEIDTGACPPKKKRPRIRDCPPGDEKKCDAVDDVFGGLQLKTVDKNDKKKCPKIDMTVMKEEEEEDPCNLKRKGTTKICPADLLKKKRRKPRKKTSAVIAPHDAKTEPPQPTRSM